MRYQLFTAVAGTLAGARDDTVAAAVVVHLVRTPRAKPEKFAETRAAVADFARVLDLGADGAVIGPLTVHAGGAGLPTTVPHPVPCWLAVVETPSYAAR